MPTFESRKLYRADIILRVEYETSNGKSSTKGVAFSKNLSSVGMCIIMPDRLAKKRKLDLVIHLPNKKKGILTKGQVLWQMKCSTPLEIKRNYYITGIQFSEMSAPDAIKESDFIKGILIQKSETENRIITRKLEKLRSKK